jgi:hypothetical protein
MSINVEIARMDVVMTWPQIPDETLYQDWLVGLKDRDGKEY